MKNEPTVADTFPLLTWNRETEFNQNIKYSKQSKFPSISDILIAIQGRLDYTGSLEHSRCFTY